MEGIQLVVFCTSMVFAGVNLFYGKDTLAAHVYIAAAMVVLVGRG